jgi:hypothetical protein
MTVRPVGADPTGPPTSPTRDERYPKIESRPAA